MTDVMSAADWAWPKRVFSFCSLAALSGMFFVANSIVAAGTVTPAFWASATIVSIWLAVVAPDIRSA